MEEEFRLKQAGGNVPPPPLLPPGAEPWEEEEEEEESGKVTWENECRGATQPCVRPPNRGDATPQPPRLGCP